MRISSISMYDNNSKRMMKTLSDWQKSSDRLSGGKRILTPSDDPIASAQILLLKQSESRNQQFQSTCKDTKDALTRQEVVLKDVTDIITNIKQKLVAANHGGLDDNDRKAIKGDLQNYKEQLVSLANAQGSGGNYLFGGFKNDTPPFEINKDGSVSYVGSDKPITVNIDDSREVTLYPTGKDVFLSGNYVKGAEADIFKTIDTAIMALDMDLNASSKESIDAYHKLIGQAAKGIDNALENNSLIRAGGGLVINEIDRLIAMRDAIEINNKMEIGALEDVDPYSAISEFYMLKTSLQATQSTFLLMQNMSLFQMK